MHELRGKEITGATIIEHRSEQDIVGQIEYASINGDGTFGIGWHHHDGGNRTTLFNPSSWYCKVISNVIFMRRLCQDSEICDIPWRTANMYTIVQTNPE